MPAVYAVGTLLLYERRGVYRVEGIGAPPCPTEDGQDYYRLCSVYSASGETIYIPVDTSAAMRPLMDAGQAEEYLELAARLEPQVFKAKKTAELAEHYRGLLASGRMEDCLLLIKEVCAKQKGLNGSGRKLGQLDQQYWKLAERLVCEELAAALDTEPERIKKRLYAAVRRKAPEKAAVQPCAPAAGG